MQYVFKITVKLIMIRNISVGRVEFRRIIVGQVEFRRIIVGQLEQVTFDQNKWNNPLLV